MAGPGVSPPRVLDAECFAFDGLGGYVAGNGPPLLLVHSVNATGSSAEIQAVFDHYRARRTVVALDLPGFGLSERSDRTYTPRLMTDALHATAAYIARRWGPAPLDALALSLGCEFSARAAAEQPGHWGRLALVSPTGFMGSKPRRGPPGSTRALPMFHKVLAAPWWSQGLFDGLTRPGVVRYFLERTWGGKAIDERVWASAVQNARAPGARHAPLQFLSGGLFSADIHTVYEALTQPVWVSHGVRGDFTDYRGLSIVAGRPNWRVSVLQTGALPYFEQPDRFFADFDTLLATRLSA
jgi:pimeloyl-ACP methyl ester carboxylesterase